MALELMANGDWPSEKPLPTTAYVARQHLSGRQTAAMYTKAGRIALKNRRLVMAEIHHRESENS